MSRSQQVENDLHRIERIQRNFHEAGIPVAHRAVPQAGELKSLKLTSLITLGTDEAGILIHIVQKIELLTFIIPDAADKVHRIEMGGKGENAPVPVHHSY